jgi:hypothetical protein
MGVYNLQIQFHACGLSLRLLLIQELVALWLFKSGDIGYSITEVFFLKGSLYSEISCQCQ